jgi:hypothetical protein
MHNATFSRLKMRSQMFFFGTRETPADELVVWLSQAGELSDAISDQQDLEDKD